MDKKLEFNKLLSELIELADKNNNILEKAQIEEHFEQLQLTDEMYHHIYHYLKGQKIYVADDTHSLADSNDLFGPPDDMDTLKEEQDFLAMYLKDLESIEPLTYEEESDYIEKLAQGDETVKKRLTEHNLMLVTTLTESYANQGVTLADLIQEGNLGLLEGISTFASDSDHKYFDFKAHIEQAIRNAMQNAVDEIISESRVHEHLANRANYLDKASAELKEQLEREPTLEDLAKHTSLPEEEVRNILKYSLDALHKSSPTDKHE